LKKFLIPTLISMIITTANAGLKEFTMHSRANCGNNETISWHAGHSYWLWTASNHWRNGVFQHYVTTGDNFENTWRSAAVHWGEAIPGSGWFVRGYHRRLINGQDYLLQVTEVNDCSIYDGWWD
jgi:hypothetical protein